MSLAVRLSLAAAGLFLLVGMLLGVLKYRRIMTSPQHRAPVYVDIAHRAAFLMGYTRHGLKDDTDNLFGERNFTTTWFMYLLIAGEIGGLSVILWGFITTQFINGH